MISWLKDISFANPLMLYFLISIPILAAWFFFKKKNQVVSIKLSSLSLLGNAKSNLKVKLRNTPFILRLLAISLIIIALARPQSKTSWQDIKTEGIDIVIAMDISASMLAKDFKPDRLEAAKEVAISFIDKRPNDRVGLVIFSGESFTQCPLTSDHSILKNLFKGVKTGMLQDGTAIGMGLATAVNRLKDSKAKSKVIILLTDGVNNAGSVSPELAAEIAVPFGIRVYTIGIGTTGMALSPVALYPNGQFAYDYVEVKIDEPILKKISELTNGKYFRATNNKKLESIYGEIDKLEKSIIEEKQYTKKNEMYLPFAALALLLLLKEFILKNTWLKTIN